MSEYIDDFTSEIPLDKMRILLDLGKEFSFDPISSNESEKYFIKLLEKYQDNNDDSLKELLRTAVAKDFQVVDKKPEWIQDPEWQFNDDRPMTFIGQLEIKQSKIRLHDDAIFYVFWDREIGITKTIIQIS
ncbi:hypothetical protein SAMN02745136_03479 [Anaerocolumna jejuensis DSM 15929]|uniref:Uncharacterized protein n=1 Tax=Anaerocolumna jejuensis DSM 15929 TaxID=1121322 RepID=A0A1M6VRS3_9FIRM|nr:hypothetical protein [Anaerocolumna jejuensis]SHK84074.1 hypothetical protein SAMN02745136_03479 [Anaerocolumna jejuensis DSM 15929]